MREIYLAVCLKRFFPAYSLVCYVIKRANNGISITSKLLYLRRIVIPCLMRFIIFCWLIASCIDSEECACLCDKKISYRGFLVPLFLYQNEREKMFSDPVALINLSVHWNFQRLLMLHRRLFFSPSRSLCCCFVSSSSNQPYFSYRRKKRKSICQRQR